MTPDEHATPSTAKATQTHGADRRIEVEVEVPGTPEEVWKAIATGPGISAWFVPTEVEPGEGGTIRQDHGEGIETEPARITAWEPPHRLRTQDPEWQPTPGSPKGSLATEYLVEARSGGTCVVKVVASGFGDGPQWDRTFEGNTVGWTSALETLRIYLTHFARGDEALTTFGAWAQASTTDAGQELRWALGLEGKHPGDRMRTAPPAPPLAGTVEAVVGDQVIVRVDEPAPGIAFVATGGPGDEVFAMVRMKLFGPDGPAAEARDAERWQAWLEDHVARDTVRGSTA